jgi:hypothetical protein
MIREEWLNKLIEKLRPMFESAEAPLPAKLRVSCSWPSKGGLAQKKRVIGQCWYPEASTDGTTEVLVSYTQADPLEVAAVLVHELVHASNGEPTGHRGKFITVAKAVGLVGPWKSTTASEELKAKLQKLIDEIGPYGHAAISPMSIEAGGGEKRQKARMILVTCQDCGYKVRTTQKWLDEKGAPLCPCNEEPMVAKEAA